MSLSMPLHRRTAAHSWRLRKEEEEEAEEEEEETFGSEPEPRGRRRLAATTAAAGVNPVLPGATLLTTRGQYIKAFLLGDGVTAVLAIPEFPSDSADPSSQNFVANLKAAFAAMPGPVTRVLLDLRGTQGQDSQPAWAAVLHLFGAEAVPRENWTAPMQLKSPTYINQVMVAAGASSYSWHLWADQQQQPFTPATFGNFFFPERMERWGGGRRAPRGRFSSFVKANVDGRVYDETATSLLETRDVIILSDGMCTSACALFLQALKLQHGVRVVTVGALPDAPVSVSNGCGGNVNNVRDMLCQMPEAVANSTLVPGNFLMGSNLEMVVAAARIPASAPFPCDFPCVGADQRLIYTAATVANPAALWAEAAKFF